MIKQKIILQRLPHEGTLFFQQQNHQHLNNQWPYMLFTTAVFCLKISYAANEIYCLTVKTNGDAAAG